jgi:hypothetical protein
MGIMRIIRVVAVVLLTLGTVMLPPPLLQAASAPASPDVLHEVLPGDCLHLIAGYYYGIPGCGGIWKANRHLVRNPTSRLGTYLLVPEAGAPAELYPTSRLARSAAAGGAAGRPPSRPKSAEAVPSSVASVESAVTM